MIPPPLPQSLKTTPRLDRWVCFNADRTVTVFSGKVELGQGIETAIAQIAADELDVALDRLSLVAGDTTQSPDERYTSAPSTRASICPPKQSPSTGTSASTARPIRVASRGTNGFVSSNAANSEPSDTMRS